MTLPADTLPALARWLTEPARLEWLRKSDLALSFHDEVKVAVERARVIIDRPQDREATVPAGTHEACGGQVVGHLPPEDDKNRQAVWGECEGCGRRWEAVEFSNLWKQMRPSDVLRPVWVSTADAAEMLGVKDATVRDYVKRGRLRCEVKARGARRVILVRQADVLALRRAG